LTRKTTKYSILFATFIVPLVFFLYLGSGTVNFEKLPVLTKNVLGIESIDKNVAFKNHITVLCFFSNEHKQTKVELFNLHEVIYKKGSQYKPFQIVTVIPTEKKSIAKNFKNQLKNTGSDLTRWHFVMADSAQIKNLFNSLQTSLSLNKDLNHAFIIDKEVNLRGRTDDEDSADGLLEGYSMQSVATLKNKLLDDLNVIFYELKFSIVEGGASND